MVDIFKAPGAGYAQDNARHIIVGINYLFSTHRHPPPTHTNIYPLNGWFPWLLYELNTYSRMLLVLI